MALSRSSARIAALSLIGLVVLGVYAQSAAFGLVYEDGNAAATMTGALTDTLRVMFSPRIIGSRYWMWFTYQLTALCGGGMAALHLTNVGIHLVNGALLGYWLRRIGAAHLSVGAVALFWLHPIQSESIAYVVMRSELLCAFGLLLMLIGMTRPSLSQQALLMLAGAWIAVGSKELGVMIPAVACVFGWIWYRPSMTGRSARLMISGAAAALLVVLVALWLHGAYFSKVIDANMSPEYHRLGYASVQACVVAKIGFRLIWPFGQQVSTSCEFVWPPMMSLALLTIIGLTLWALVRVFEERTRWLHIAILLTMLWWLPRWLIPSREFITEHHWYVPMLFLSIAATAEWHRSFSSRPGVSA